MEGEGRRPSGYIRGPVPVRSGTAAGPPTLRPVTERTKDPAGAPARLPGATPGTPLDAWHRGLATVLRTVYFGRVRGAGTPHAGPVPRLVVASHRNGAIDGFQVLAAHPRAQFLVSVQLLSSPVLRVLFTGIPVVRAKDVRRYGIDPRTVSDPVEAGCAQLRSGEDLAIFPEGTSEWGHGPQAYQRGAARIACRLLDEGVDVSVLPVGLHYSTPDAFRSRAEVYEGPPVDLPPRHGRTDRDWEDAVADAIGDALDVVSVNCPDPETFERVEAAALRRARAGESYAEAFLDEQARAVGGGHHAVRPVVDGGNHGVRPDGPGTTTRRGRSGGGGTASSAGGAGVGGAAAGLVRGLGLLLLWLFWPVLVVGHLAGTRADGRNTVSFFRIMGGLAAAVLWVPALLVAAFFWPWVVAAGAVSALVGWSLLGVRRWRP